MKKTKTSFIIIIILAFVSALGSWSYLSGAKTTIYLFKDNYPAGTKITSDILVPQQMDTKIVDQLKLQSNGPQYITSGNIDHISGSFLRGDVSQGTPLMTTESSEIGGTPAEARLGENMVAVTIPTDNVTGGSPKITSGARINIYSGFQQDSKSVEQLLLQNVRVIDVEYSEVMNDSTKTPTLSGITVEVTPAQSSTLQFSAEFGKIRVGIIKSGHYKETSVSDYSVDNIKTQTAASSQQAASK